MKKYLLFGMLAAILAGALVLAGCENAAGGLGPAGSNGAGGPASPNFLSGSLSTDAIQRAIDFTYSRPASVLGGAVAEGGFGDKVYAPLYFDGVVQTDDGVIVVPEDRKIKLLGTSAIRLADGGTIVVAHESGIDTSITGKITGTAGGATSYAIVPNALSGFVDTNPALITNVEIKGGADDLPASGPVAILGPVTVTGGDTDGKNFKNTGTDLNGKDIYIIGSGTDQTAFTVSSPLTTGNVASSVNVIDGKAVINAAAAIGNLWAEGDVTLGAALTGSVDTEGVLAINAANATLVNVKAGSVTSGAHAVVISGNFEVAGTSSFGDTAAFGSNASFGGNAEFTGAATFGGDVVIGSTASLVLAGGNLVVPTGSSIVVADTNKALVLGTGDITATATITSGDGAVIKAATAAQVEVLLPKAGAAFLVSLENDGTLAADTTVRPGTTLDIVAGKTLTVGDGRTLTVSADGIVNAAGTLELGGTTGTLTLVKKGAGSTAGGKLQLAAAGKLTTGAAAGTATNIASVVGITIGGKAVNNTSFGVADWELDGAATDRPLQQLGGTAWILTAPRR